MSIFNHSARLVALVAAVVLLTPLGAAAQTATIALDVDISTSSNTVNYESIWDETFMQTRMSCTLGAPVTVHREDFSDV